MQQPSGGVDGLAFDEGIDYRFAAQKHWRGGYVVVAGCGFDAIALSWPRCGGPSRTGFPGTAIISCSDPSNNVADEVRYYRAAPGPATPTAVARVSNCATRGLITLRPPPGKPAMKQNSALADVHVAGLGAPGQMRTRCGMSWRFVCSTARAGVARRYQRHRNSTPPEATGRPGLFDVVGQGVAFRHASPQPGRARAGNQTITSCTWSPPERACEPARATLTSSVVDGREYEISFRARWPAGASSSASLFQSLAGRSGSTCRFVGT